VSTPIEPLSQPAYATFEDASAPPAVPVIDPDNPPWGIGGAALAWLGSMVLLAVIPSVAAIFYSLARHGTSALRDFNAAMEADPNIVLTLLAAHIPAHLLTLGVAWAVVTRFGKRPFWQTLGWRWSENFGFWKSAGLAVGLLIFGLVLTNLLGGDKTQFEELVTRNTATRWMTAFLATASAPLVEEIMYRGVLYSALQRVTGKLWAIVGVSALFTLIHVFQYFNNFGVIAVIAVLSLVLTYVRARTGQLLPCFIIHLIFNGLSSLTIVLEPYFRQFETGGQQKAGALITLAARHIEGIF